jgi:hypothetical protein
LKPGRVVLYFAMPSIKLSVPHKLGADEAKRRITQLIGEARGQFGHSVSDVKESWVDNRGTFSFRAMGFSVSGNLQVEPATVEMDINLPFAALPLKGRIENELSSKAKTLLA